MSILVPQRILIIITILSITLTAIPMEVSKAAEDENYDIKYDSSAGAILITLKRTVEGHNWKASVYYEDQGVQYVTETAVAMASPEENSIRITDVSGALENLSGNHYYIDLTPNEGSGEILHFEFTYSDQQGPSSIVIAIAAIAILIVSIALILLVRRLTSSNKND